MHKRNRLSWLMMGLVSLAVGCQPEEPVEAPTAEVGTRTAAVNTLGAWSASASMSAPRSGHVATVAGAGQVLVVGGGGTAEVYDPAANVWAPTGSPLLADRSAFTATRLPSGQVLVAGGTASDGTAFPWQTSAELYDPATGTWSFTGSMSGYRARHTATLLDSGKVLVVGGYVGPRSATGDAELYDPATGTWSPAASTYPSGDHTATLLDSGKVLVTGGYVSGYGVLRETRVYDPATNTWTLTGYMSIGRSGHHAVRLGSGKVLVLGAGTNSVDVFTPSTQQWSQGPAIPIGGYYQSASLLSTGEVLVLNDAGQGALYDPVKNVWRTATPLQPARSTFATVQLPDGAGDGDGRHQRHHHTGDRGALHALRPLPRAGEKMRRAEESPPPGAAARQEPKKERTPRLDWAGLLHRSFAPLTSA